LRIQKALVIFSARKNNRMRIPARSLYLFLILVFTGVHTAFAQKQDIQPTIEPALFTPGTEITVRYDVTDNVLKNLGNAWIWVWIPDEGIDARFNINPASNNSAATDKAKFTKSTQGGVTVFTITFIPEEVFDVDIGGESKLGMLLKGNDWSNGQTVDYIADMAGDEFSVLLVAPATDPVFVSEGALLDVQALSTDFANYLFFINDVLVDEQNNTKDYRYEHSVTEAAGTLSCELRVSSLNTPEDSVVRFSYVIRSPTVERRRPDGIIPGINHTGNDASRVTLCLLAPMKSSVYVLGDFNDYAISKEYLMYRDGEFFWLEIDNLAPNREYAFQYLVDEKIYIADPYADKILDPDDRWIPAAIYPDLKPYPPAALKKEWYFNRLSVFSTGQVPFSWQHDGYERPDKDHLIIYELLIRDFFASDGRSYEHLVDTLTYLKALGINAIELMPIQEFNGNSSWGYNTTFMFAPDKAYGTREMLKKFIDAAHGAGIAVILDVVFNHQDLPSPYVAMYFDFRDGVFRPAADNPWFNTEATHPFSVFFDMNHESPYTRHFLDTALHYWIREYHIDGFRFDLSKGFTQTVSGSNVPFWGQLDQSRIDNLTRMADRVWSYAPETWLILEHFAENREETILADYGFLLWGNQHSPYKESILGYHDNMKSDLSWGYAPVRGWRDLNLVTYMESHDEERQMYGALQYGNSGPGYNVKDLQTALNRIKAASAFLYTVPGPKMFWQFGELGYDISIEENGRTGEKPVLWNYFNEPERRRLYDLKAALLAFRMENPVFRDGGFNWSTGGEIKRIALESDEMKMLVIGNFGVRALVVPANFPIEGMWFDFFSGESYEVSEGGMNLHFEPGEFHIYTTQKIEGVPPGLVPWGGNFVITSAVEDVPDATLYPNPAGHYFRIKGIPDGAFRLKITDTQGRILVDRAIHLPDQDIISVSDLPEGLFFTSLSNQDRNFMFRLLVH
jgi:hypothetical protein